MRLALHPPTATTETQRRPASHRARARPNTADQTEVPAYFRSPEARRSAIDITHHSVGRSVAPREVSRVRQQLKQGRRDRAPDLCNITVHDDPAAQRACATLGAVAFARGSRIYLGGAIGQHGFPGQTHVLRHELLHVAQSRIGQRSHTLDRRSRIEAQAEHFARHGRLEGPLLAADPNEIYGIWPLVMAGLAAAYVLLRPNVANAPGPGDATLPSVSPLQVAGEAFALFLVPELVAARIGLAGLAGWRLYAGSAAVGSSTLVSYRGVQDVGQQRFSGVDAYATDAAVGGAFGLWAVGPMSAATSGMQGPQLLLRWGGAGVGMGVTARASGDLHQGELSSPGTYGMWAAGGGLLGLAGGGGILATDAAASRLLYRSDIAMSQRMAAAGPLSAEQVSAMYAARPDRLGRLSAGWIEGRGMIQVYRGQTQPFDEILSPFAREGGVAFSQEWEQRMLSAGLTPDEIAGYTARFNGEEIPPFLLDPIVPTTRPGAVGIPTSRLPGVGADFARSGGETVTALQPTLYVIRVPRNMAIDAGPLGWATKSPVELEQVLFNSIPARNICLQVEPPAGLPSLRASEEGFLVITPR